MKKCLNGKIIFVLSMFFLSTQLFSQNDYKKHSSDWQILKEDGLVKISYRYDNCNLVADGINKEEVYLQFENLSQNSITVNWELELKYGSKCYNCLGDNDELKFSMTLKPNEIIEGKCGEQNTYELNILSKFLGGESPSKLSDFNINALNSKINNIK